MTKPGLIVPIRDRRAHKRILTLRNVRNALVVIAVLFLAVTIQSDLRHPKSGEYGRLFSKQVPGQDEIARPRQDVIREAPVPDQTAADPLLLAPAAREQYLGVDGNLSPAGEPALRQEPPAHSDLAIVSGPNGVTITRAKSQPPQQPTLSGGIFRQ